MKNPIEIFRILTISTRQCFYFSKSRIKSFAPEPYLEIQKNPEAPEIKKESAFPQIEIAIKKYDKLEQDKGDSARAESKPIPCSPTLYPIKVSNPKVGKKYRWCACGMSLNQPFCDGSHEGSRFKPLRFVVEEECKSIELCGCKFTTAAPFCDKKTCTCLKTGKIENQVKDDKK